jgi:hypothetical protein
MELKANRIGFICLSSTYTLASSDLAFCLCQLPCASRHCSVAFTSTDMQSASIVGAAKLQLSYIPAS